MQISRQSIYSSVPNGSYVYIDELVTITCITRGSYALQWQSPQLFSGDDIIACTRDNHEGDTCYIGTDMEVRVILVHIDTTEIESQILFLVGSSYDDITITCRNVDYDTSSSITLRVNGK